MRLFAEYGFTDRFGVEIQLPFKLYETSVVYRRLDGTAFTPDYSNIHHRNETLLGVGDPWLLGRVSLAMGGFATTARVGVALPLGSTEANPFQLGAMGLAHQHIQFGTGTVDPLAALDVARRLGERGQVRLGAQAHLGLYENAHGYRAGNRFSASIVASLSIGPYFDLGATADLQNEQPERWDGEVKQDGNLGRTDAFVGVLAWCRVGALTLLLGIKVPVVQHIAHRLGESGQLSVPAIVTLGIQRP